jgi:hypothetical protein
MGTVSEEVMHSSETSVHLRATRLYIAENGNTLRYDFIDFKDRSKGECPMFLSVAINFGTSRNECKGDEDRFLTSL